MSIAALVLGLFLTLRPASARDPIPPESSQQANGEASGSYRSIRSGAMGGDSGSRGGGEGQVEADRTGPVTLDDARGTFQTLVESWLQANRSGDGLVRLKDPDTGKVRSEEH